MEELLQYPSRPIAGRSKIDRIKASPELAVLLKSKVGEVLGADEGDAADAHLQRADLYLDVYVLPEFAGVLDLPNPSGAPVVRQIEEHLSHRAAHAQIEILVGHVTAELAEPLMAQEKRSGAHHHPPLSRRRRLFRGVFAHHLRPGSPGALRSWGAEHRKFGAALETERPVTAAVGQIPSKSSAYALLGRWEPSS